jgi:hypothetical protein
VRRVLIGVAVLVTVTLCASAWASPSLLGPTGLLKIPSADVLGMSEFAVGITGVSADAHGDQTILYGTIGLLPDLELGVTRYDIEDAKTETTLNGKLRVLGPLPGEVTLAVGMDDITDQLDRSIYVVASHTLGAGILTRFGQVTSPQVHVGIGGGRLDGLFAGISTTVERRVGLMAEYDGNDFNFGARLPVAPHLEGTIAVLDGLDDVGLGLSFSSPW